MHPQPEWRAPQGRNSVGDVFCVNGSCFALEYHSGDTGAWAVFEQQIFRVPHSHDRGIGVFGRISGAPADWKICSDLYADAGLEFIGLNDKRPDDKLGIAAGYAHISKRAQQLDVDYRNFVSSTWPQRERLRASRLGQDQSALP